MGVIPADILQELHERNAAFGGNGSRPERPFGYRTLREIAENPIPAPPMQIEGICREGEVGILTGPANRLKSRTGAELAVAVASGLPALGRFRVERPGKALIIQNEIHAGVYDERMMRYADVEAGWCDNLLVVSRQDFRIDPENMLRLDTLMAQEGITFAVLDPISEMWPLDEAFDENRAPDVTVVIERLKALRDKGRTILFVHHDPKDDARRARGSGRLVDAPDLRIYLSKANKKGMEIARARVHVESRTLPPPEDFDVVLGNDGKLRHQSASMTDEQTETLDALSRLGRVTVAELAQALSIDQHTTRGRLKRLLEKGKAVPDGERPARWSLT
jgi:RecA-family ATPase